MPERVTPEKRRSEKSAEAVVAVRTAKGRTRGRAGGPLARRGPAADVQLLEFPFEDRGEAPNVERSVEASTAPVVTRGLRDAHTA